MAFGVASVKPSKMPHSPDFPMDASSNFSPGRRFSSSVPLMVYINFAYKLTPPEQPAQDQPGSALPHIPGWVRGDEFFAIEALAEGNPTKDQLRLMMQSLLADRFKLAVHFETREVPVFALTLVKAGKAGPRLLAHIAGPPCPDSYTLPANSHESPSDAFPQNCGTPGMREKDGLRVVGARDVPLSSLANSVYLTGRMAGEIDRPVVDRTGLDGRFDFLIEFKPGGGDRIRRVGAPDDEAPSPDSPTTPFLEALREQLGLKVVASKGPVRRLIIDRVERPSEN
jgi:uncharacterized protein (TIGR03435 family)